MVDSEEGHLTRFIEQVGEGDEGFSFLQVEDQHSSDERHALNLKHHKHRWRTALKVDGGLTLKVCYLYFESNVNKHIFNWNCFIWAVPFISCNWKVFSIKVYILKTCNQL